MLKEFVLISFIKPDARKTLNPLGLQACSLILKQIQKILPVLVASGLNTKLLGVPSFTSDVEQSFGSIIGDFTSQLLSDWKYSINVMVVLPTNIRSHKFLLMFRSPKTGEHLQNLLICRSLEIVKKQVTLVK